MKVSDLMLQTDILLNIKLITQPNLGLNLALESIGIIINGTFKVVCSTILSCLLKYIE